MNVRLTELTQPVVKLALNSGAAVSNLDTARARGFLQQTGVMPLLVLFTAATATVLWNGFLLWKLAALVVGWMGF